MSIELAKATKAADQNLIERTFFNQIIFIAVNSMTFDPTTLVPTAIYPRQLIWTNSSPSSFELTGQ